MRCHFNSCRSPLSVGGGGCKAAFVAHTWHQTRTKKPTPRHWFARRRRRVAHL